MNKDRTYYEILEINEKASQEVVRMAYKALALKFHPDRFQGDRIYANDQMQKINEAYEVISNPLRRSTYDDLLSKIREDANKYYQNRENTDRKRDEGKESSTSEDSRRNSNAYKYESKEDSEDVSHSSRKISESIVFILLFLSFITLIVSYEKNLGNIVPVSHLEDKEEYEDVGAYSTDSNDSDQIIFESTQSEGEKRLKSEQQSVDNSNEVMNEINPTSAKNNLDQEVEDEVETESSNLDTQYQDEIELYETDQISYDQDKSTVSENANIEKGIDKNEEATNKEMVFKLNATTAKMKVGSVWTASVSYEQVGSYDNFYPHGLYVRWYSSDSSIASVEAYEHNSAHGVVEFIRPGEAIITAELDNGLTASAKIICIE